jgi:hypothetical protein
LNVFGAVFSTIPSVAKRSRVVARTPLTSGRTCGTSCCMSHPLASAWVWRFMWAPLMRTQFARTACPGSWILSSCCRAVPAPGVMLYAPLLPPLFSWWALLWRTTLFLRARVCSLRGSCVALCLLSRCRLCLVLLGVAPFSSAPLGVLRPKPRWGRAWSPIWFFFFPPLLPRVPQYWLWCRLYQCTLCNSVMSKYGSHGLKSRSRHHSGKYMYQRCMVH